MKSCPFDGMRPCSKASCMFFTSPRGGCALLRAAETQFGIAAHLEEVDDLLKQIDQSINSLDLFVIWREIRWLRCQLWDMAHPETTGKSDQSSSQDKRPKEVTATSAGDLERDGEDQS